MTNRKPLVFAWALALMACLAACGMGTRPLGDEFTYDLTALRAVDPALVTHVESGSFPAGVDSAAGLAVAPGGRIVVAGADAWAVLDGSGKVLRRRALDIPATCVGVGLDGDIYVACRDRVFAYEDAEAEEVAWAPLDKRAHITSIAVRDDDLFVADAGHRRVKRFSKEGDLLGTIDARTGDRDVKGFIVPSPLFDVAIGVDDSLWVVNPGLQRLENYRDNGDLVTTWGEASSAIEGFCGCCNPSHIAIAADGTFVTSEKGLERVKTYGPDGTFKGVVAPPAAFKEGTVGLDLAVDGDGRILVLDPASNRIRVFVLNTEH